MVASSEIPPKVKDLLWHCLHRFLRVVGLLTEVVRCRLTALRTGWGYRPCNFGLYFCGSSMVVIDYCCSIFVFFLTGYSRFCLVSILLCLVEWLLGLSGISIISSYGMQTHLQWLQLWLLLLVSGKIGLLRDRPTNKCGLLLKQSLVSATCWVHQV